MLTPLASIIVADNVASEVVQFKLAIGVKEILGPDLSFGVPENSSAPASAGLALKLFVMSVVTLVMPVPSANPSA